MKIKKITKKIFKIEGSQTQIILKQLRMCSKANYNKKKNKKTY